MKKGKLFNCIASLLSIYITTLIFTSCSTADITPFKTFILKEGTAHFSLEYSSLYKIKEYYSGDPVSTISTTNMSYITLVNLSDTQIDIIVDKPDDYAPTAQDSVNRAERNASSFPDYKLLEKSQLVIDNIPAFRIDYTERNLTPIDMGTPRPIDVFREVYFDSKGLSWMISIKSDLSTADTDKPDFEHVLQTFKILD